jgi:hypothetical protein
MISAGKIGLLALLLAVLVVFIGSGPAHAQDDEWTVVLTPQVWFSHITDNGFASPPRPIQLPERCFC